MPPFYAEIAQSVEQRTENPRVDGSIPPLGTTSYSHISHIFKIMPAVILSLGCRFAFACSVKKLVKITMLYFFNRRIKKADKKVLDLIPLFILKYYNLIIIALIFKI